MPLCIPILDDVRKRGDEALIEYTSKFDKVDLTGSPGYVVKNFWKPSTLVDDELKKAIETAVRNIETFHKTQQIKPERVETSPGVTCWQKAVAIQKVGLICTRRYSTLVFHRAYAGHSCPHSRLFRNSTLFTPR